MHIKEDRKLKFNFGKYGFINFLLGGGDEKDLQMYTLSLTLGIWFAIFVAGSIVWMAGVNSMVYIESVVFSLMIASIIAFGVAIISILAHTDFNRIHGWGIWRRIIIYNMLMFTVTYSLHVGVTSTEKRERVSSFQLVSSDIKNCQYMVKMKSKSLVYKYCSDYDTTFNRIKNNPTIDAYLIGKIRYGTNIANHYEFVDSTINVK